MSRGDRRRRRHEKDEEALRHLRSTLRGCGDNGESVQDEVRKWLDPALLFHIFCHAICAEGATP